ncbi:amino acid ABC transporter substrate-binding protein [Aquabacterium sp.]|uniref:amino acid ABC transporter substrate-binding protein n=1 Tax=Aquabacterium sp. TaxID=1872578 RepID=UPI003D6D8C63
MSLLRHTSLRQRVILAALGLTLALPAWAGKTLDAIRERGKVQCGVSTGVAGFSAPDSQGRWTGLDVDVCRALAAAVLGDGDKVNFVPLNSQQRFTSLQSGQVDLLSRNTSWTLTRDASLGFHFAAVTYYDGQGFLVPKKLKVSSARQLRNAQVCIQSGTTTEKNLSDFSRSQGVPFKPVVYDSFEAAFKAFFSGRCQAYTTDASGLAILLNKEASHPEDYMILPELISKEPLGPLVRRGDDEWFAIVKWTVFALLEAEELGLTQGNIDSFRTSNSPSIQRFVGTGEDMGKLLGLDKAWSYRIVKTVGNYGEVYERNVGAKSLLKLPRGPNRLWSQGGLMYVPPIR